MVIYIKNQLLKNYLLVLAASAALYIATKAPSLLWQDSGMIQYRVLHNDIQGGLGLALSHPLYYIISIAVKYIPIGNIISRINIVSAIAAAFAVANMYLLVRLWLGKSMPAVVAALTLAVSHTFWWHAAVVETYDMYMAFFLAELICLVLYLQNGRIINICLLGLFNGLAVSVHMLAVIPLACYAVYILYLLINRRIKIQTVCLFSIFWIIGAMPYEYLIVKEIVHTGDFFAVIRSALFGQSWRGDVLNTAINAKIIKENIFFFGMNFPTLNIIFAFAGLCSAFKFNRQRTFGRFIVVLTLLFLLFAFRYTVPDRYAFFIPFYSLTALLTGLGVYMFRQKYPQKTAAAFILFLSVMPVFVYMFLPTLAEKYYPVFENRRKLPYRSEYDYFLKPWKAGYRGADLFAHQAIENVPPNALLFADGTSLYPLAIAKQIYFPEKNITIMSSHGSYDNISEYSEQQLLNLIDSHPSYVVSKDKGYCPAYILLNYTLTGEEVLFRIEKNSPKTTP